MKILLIDDSQDSLNLLTAFLQNAGYQEIIATKSAHEAFTVLGIEGAARSDDHATRFDLILLDILMPEMDGIEICRRIKRNKRVADIPIVMLTGADKLKKMEEAFDAGAMDYIRKPIEKIELLARVRSIFRLREAEKNSRQCHTLEVVTTVLDNFICDALLNRLSAISMSLWLCKKETEKKEIEKYMGHASQETIDFLSGIKAFQKTKEPQFLTVNKTPLAPIFTPICSKRILMRYDGDSFPIPKQITIRVEGLCDGVVTENLNDLFTVAGYEYFINIAVQEILINAVESYPPGESSEEEVIVRILKEEDNIIISIKDSGCGMLLEEIPKVLLPFYKILGTKKSFRLGGLGAYIALDGIARCGGSITYESTVGKGTTARICLQSFVPEN